MVPPAAVEARPDAAALGAPLAPSTPPPACSWRITDEDVPVWRDATGVERTPEPDVPSLAMHVLGGGTPRIDRFANVGDCSPSGTCLHVVLQGCGGGRHRAVWGPEYAVDVDVVTEGGRNRIVVVERRTAAGCDLPRRTILDWTRDRWRPGPACALPSDAPERVRCSHRLPACEGPPSP